MHHIREIRNSTKLSQKQFADLFHIPVSTLRKWEQNVVSPPSYLINLIKATLPQTSDEYEVYVGGNGDKYYLDRENKRVSDSLGNWIKYHEDIDGVIEDNIGIYIETLFNKYYEAIKDFDDELIFDKKHKIRWR